MDRYHEHKQTRKTYLARAVARASTMSKSTKTKLVVAVHHWDGEVEEGQGYVEGQLVFKKDDRIVVTDRSDPDWWEGYLENKPETAGVICKNVICKLAIAWSRVPPPWSILMCPRHSIESS